MSEQNHENHVTSSLSPRDLGLYDVPKGGKWFWDQQSVLALIQDQKGFVVAWDKNEGQGHKVYGFYTTPEDFYEALLLIPADKRWGYEIIPNGSPCKLYLDVEWDGVDDSKDHTKIKTIVQNLRDRMRNFFDGSVELYLACSTRVKHESVFKNSYHLVCPNFVFRCNHDGVMKCFVESICQGDNWFYTKNGKKTCLADMSVYTRNRCIRLPSCSKKGSSVPFRRINGDAIDAEDDFQAEYNESDQDSWQPFITTNPDIDGDVKVIEGPSPVKQSSTKRSKPEDIEEGQANVKRPRESSAGARLPIQLSELEDVLKCFGDNVSKPTKVQFIEPIWQIQCNQKKQSRKCLVNEKKVHESNNCILFLKPAEIGQLQLQYHCTSSGCKHENRILGHFGLSPVDYTWSFAASEAYTCLDMDEEVCDQAETSFETDDSEEVCDQAETSLDMDENMCDQAETTFEMDDSEEVCDQAETSFEMDDSEEVCDQAETSLDMDEEVCDQAETSLDMDEEVCDQAETSPGMDENMCNQSTLAEKERTASVKDETNSNNGADDSKAKKMPYQARKRIFEQNNMKVRDPFIYLRTEKGSDGSLKFTQFKHAEFRQFYIDLFYSRKNDEGVWVEKPFIDAWLHDPRKREVSSIVVDPRRSLTDGYNLWSGFRAEKLNPSAFFQDMDPDQAMQFVMAPVLRHIVDVITCGNMDHANWVLDWMANIVQRPWQKTQVPLLLYGKQGCGKGIIFDVFREHTLGPAHSYQTADPQRDLFERFSDGLVNKVFVQVDEATCLQGNAEKLKNTVTNRTITWEAKNGRIVTVNNYANLLFTSNNENVMVVTSDDRRNVLFRCSSIHKGDVQYFAELAAHLERADVQAWFYKHLMERDLSRYPYDFQASRPITEYYKEAQRASVPLEKLYLAALINSDARYVWASTEMYQSFKRWAETGGHKHIKAHVSFSRDICRIDGVVHKRSHGATKYELDFKTIRSGLESTNEFDERSFLH